MEVQPITNQRVLDTAFELLAKLEKGPSPRDTKTIINKKTGVETAIESASQYKFRTAHFYRTTLGLLNYALKFVTEVDREFFNLRIKEWKLSQKRTDER